MLKLSFLEESIYAFMLVIALWVPYHMTRPERLVTERVVDLSSDFQGSIQREDDRLLIGGGKGYSEAKAEAKLQAHREYLVRLKVEGDPELHFDFVAPNYHSGDNLISKGQKGEQEYRIQIDSKDAPPYVTFRLFHMGPGNIVVRSLSVDRLSLKYAAIRGVLLGLIFLVLSVYVWRYIRRPSVQALAIFVLAFLAYRMVKIPDLECGMDSYYYVPTSVSLLSEGNWDLSEYKSYFNVPTDLRLNQIGTRWYTVMPIGTSIVTLPLVWLGRMLYQETHGMDQLLEVAAFCAKILAAFSVAIFFLIASRLAGTKPAIVATLVFAFGTTHFSNHAGGLWSHNTTVALFLLAIALMLTERLAWLTGVVIALGFITRPDFAVIALLIFVWLALRQSRQCLLAISCVIPIMLWFVLHSLSIWGTLLPPYYSGIGMASGNMFIGMVGTLICPNRGLFVYSPILLFSLYGVWAAIKDHSIHRIYLFLSGVWILQWLVVAHIISWEGGASFGPRLLSQSLPAACLLLLPFLLRIGTLRWKYPAMVAFTILALFSGFVHLRGATSWDTRVWNVIPPMDANQSRLWDLKDWQPLRGLTNPLKR